MIAIINRIDWTEIPQTNEVRRLLDLFFSTLSSMCAALILIPILSEAENFLKRFLKFL